jgi:hypothetical protein
LRVHFWKAIALDRNHRVLRPGGVLRLWDVIYAFEPAEADHRIEERCSSGSTVSHRSWSREELEEHLRVEHSTFSWLLEPMMRHCGFELEVAEYSEDGIFAKYVLRRT